MICRLVRGWSVAFGTVECGVSGVATQLTQSANCLVAVGINGPSKRPR